MPPFKRFRRSFRAGSRFKRRRYGRPSNSALRLKMGGLGLRRFKRAGRRPRRFGAKRWPRWFLPLIKSSPLQLVSGNYGNQIAVARNATGICTHWKSLSLVDIKFLLDDQAGALNSTATTAATNNARKAYLIDITRQHVWRNAAHAGETTIQFYVLYPRRDLPAAGAEGQLARITPPCNYTFTSGGTLQNPTLFSTPISDMSAPVAGGSSIIGGTVNTQWSPFWSPALTSLFKIKLLKVKGPNGLASKQRLQPGQECVYEGKVKGPKMYNYNKLGMCSTVASTVAGTWEMLRETPVILCVHQGSVDHDSADKTQIGTTPVFLDYLQNWKFKFITPTSNTNATQINPTSGYPTVAGNPTQVPVVLAYNATVDEAF